MGLRHVEGRTPAQLTLVTSSTGVTGSATIGKSLECPRHADVHRNRLAGIPAPERGSHIAVEIDAVAHGIGDAATHPPEIGRQCCIVEDSRIGEVASPIGSAVNALPIGEDSQSDEVREEVPKLEGQIATIQRDRVHVFHKGVGVGSLEIRSQLTRNRQQSSPIHSEPKLVEVSTESALPQRDIARRRKPVGDRGCQDPPSVVQGHKLRADPASLETVVVQRAVHEGNGGVHRESLSDADVTVNQQHPGSLGS